MEKQAVEPRGVAQLVGGVLAAQQVWGSFGEVRRSGCRQRSWEGAESNPQE